MFSKTFIMFVTPRRELSAIFLFGLIAFSELSRFHNVCDAAARIVSDSLVWSDSVF